MATFGNFWWFFFLMGIGLAVWRLMLSQDVKAVCQDARGISARGMLADGGAGVVRNHLIISVIQRRMAFARLGYVGLGFLTIVSLVVSLVS